MKRQYLIFVLLEQITRLKRERDFYRWQVRCLACALKFYRDRLN